MSTLYLGTDQERLAHKLAESLDQSVRAGDFFRPATIVVPNRFLGKWLRLWLARTMGVAMNLRLVPLETALWQLLRQVDPRPQPLPLELIDHDGYRLMVLSVLLEKHSSLSPSGGESDSDVATLMDYLGPDRQLTRESCRRAWNLADRLAGLIRDYEYHRQQILMQRWLRNELGYPQAGAATVQLERGQRAMFQDIIREPDGKRARLGQAAGKLFKTLPQYAMEVMELEGALLSLPPSPSPSLSLSPEQREREGEGEREREGERQPLVIHFFGLTQISALHLHTLRWLGRFFDLRIYHLNPLVAQFPDSLRSRHEGETIHKIAQSFRRYGRPGRAEDLEADESPAPPQTGPLPPSHPLSVWGQAGAESLWLVGDLLSADETFEAEICQPSEHVAPAGRPTVLQRLQDHILNRPVSAERIPQDTSLQIAACPGIYREVETVHNSILFNLQHNPQLKQTDIAVLATDIGRYRPVLQAVFERQPKRLLYNLADFSAAGQSTFGQALLGILDLAQESFTRSRVFSVLLNPCFLAHLGVERAQALVWLNWAEELGIYHGWDRRDKEERGYAGTPLFAWRLGLQRLRLGRVMDVEAADRDGPAPSFQNVIPYADLASSDKEQLDAFCRAVEGLLPVLVGLRTFHGTGAQWAREIELLIKHFLAIPADRPQEAQVRDLLLESLGKLRFLDLLHPTSRERQRPERPEVSSLKLPLALVREIVQENLEALQGTRGELLTGGVTMAGLPTFRPVPFQIIYILGMGEDLFPGNNVLPPFDLRDLDRRPGDIRPAEAQRFVFLEALLAARSRVCLLYTSRDLQKDQDLHPAVPLAQLRRFLEERVVEQSFQTVQVPLYGHDPKYVDRRANDAATDLFVNYAEAERLLALGDVRQTGGVQLDARQAQEWHRKLAGRQRTFDMPADRAAGQEPMPTVALRELSRFLLCPAEAGLRRHLRLEDDEEPEQQDDEPLRTDTLLEHRLVLRALDQFIARALKSSVADAVREWRPRFRALYEEWQLRCRVPEGAFGAIDQAELERTLEERIIGPGGLNHFLRQRQKQPLCGPVLIGESLTPVGARWRFPALELNLARTAAPLFCPPKVRVVGDLRLVWSTDKTVEALVLTHSDKNVSDTYLTKPMLQPLLFYLALLSGTASAPAGTSSQVWLGDRSFRLHVAHPQGMATVRYGPGTIGRDKARAYLERLAADFLDPSCFDLIPFDLIMHKELCEAAFAPPAEALKWRKRFVSRLRRLADEDQEKEHPQYRRPEFLELAAPSVPDDAFEKVRRRFCLLDRPLARKRRHRTKEPK